jgi:hypothetical protein
MTEQSTYAMSRCRADGNDMEVGNVGAISGFAAPVAAELDAAERPAVLAGVGARARDRGGPFPAHLAAGPFSPDAYDVFRVNLDAATNPLGG